MTSRSPAHAGIKRGRGQPRLREGTETVGVLLRIADTDLALIDRAAEHLGVSRSELIRDAALARSKRVVKNPRKA